MVAGEKLGLTNLEWSQLANIIYIKETEGKKYDLVWNDPRVQKIFEALEDPYCSFECRQWCTTLKMRHMGGY